jgi:predicted phosphodiesterase
MRLQLLSDLHLETESFAPEPAGGAELLVLAGDIDSRWEGFEQFRHWPVPVVLIAGNHEFDERDITGTWPALRGLCNDLGITLLECERHVVTDAHGRRIRLVGTTRWCDFDVFGATQRAKAMRAAGYYMRVMRASRHGLPFDASAVREEALACRAWLEEELAGAPARSDDEWDATVVVTHFAPSLRSADPRYGHQPGTASFCNADDDLLQHADLWIHGHLHCRHDYLVGHAQGRTRVVCNARGHSRRGEVDGWRGDLVIEV